MREILFRGKRKNGGFWLFGDLRQWSKTRKGIHDYSLMGTSEVEMETVGQFTGLTDKNGKRIFEGDIIRFLHYVGTVVFEEGCFGIAISCNDAFDWDYIDEEMKEYAGINQITACFNDHFISLWEILWNFNCDQNICNVVEVIGNIHDNPELLNAQ